MKDYGSDKKRAVQAKFDAQKIAFGPIMFQAALAMRNLGMMEALDKNKKTGLSIEETAEKCKISVYGVKVILEAAISMEIVFVQDDRFFLSKTGWFLLHDELTRVNMDFTHDVNYLGFFHLEEAIRAGKPEGLKVFGKWDTVYEALAELPPKVQDSWFGFDHYYSDVAFPDVLPLLFKNKPAKIMDVGGNTGKFAIQCCKFDEKVEVTILDLPNQLKMAEKNIKMHGFEGRISGHGLNLLDHSKPFPTGYDFVWMSQFLDCFSQEDVVELIKRGKAALNEEGVLYILETYWDKQKFEASTYSLHATSLYFTCIANGCSQMYHSDDMFKMVDKAGMVVDEIVEDIGVSHTLLKCKKK